MTARKPPKETTARKPAPSVAGQALSAPKKAASKTATVASAGHGEYAVIGPTQLRQVDKMLTRIERKGEALAASADRLLRRVS
jgi:hypothetical protein